MPLIDGLQVAREILSLNSEQRIIFASAYVKEVLLDSIKELKQIVEVVQKPFEPEMLAELVEDISTVEKLRELTALAKEMGKRGQHPTATEIDDLLQLLRKIQKSSSI